MKTPAFQFKQFTVEQELCAFKVGTDSVLLGAWADSAGAKKILDIGTGSGVLALMMAQKSAAQITAIDLDEGAFSQATQNAKSSPWSDRISVKLSSVQNFVLENELQQNTFDLIITNPPYFVNKAHATGTALSNARNTDKLPFSELAKSSFKLLSPEGAFYVVLPTPEAKVFKLEAEKVGFVLAKLLRVQTKAGEAFEKRQLMCFQKSAFKFQEEVLVIEHERAEGGPQNYTDAYRSLTKDFYLAF